MFSVRTLMVILTAATLLAACGGTSPGSSATAVPATTSAPLLTGGTVRIGNTAAPDSLNPGAAYLLEAFELFGLVYESLIGINLRNEAIPQLAREWSVGEDGKTWTFKLHEGAKWHDGTALTAEDVAFTWNMIRGFEAFALLKTYTDGIASVTAPDPLTVVLVFEGTVANTDERFASIPILPKHIWQQFADSDAAIAFENLELIGSGPFRLVEYKQGEFVRLGAVKDHYLSPPNIDEVILRTFGNGDALVQALRSSEVDLIGVPSNTVVRSLQTDPNLKVEIGEGLGLSDIFFNVVDPAKCPPDVGKCTAHPAIADVRVRQALAHATDKQQLIDVILLGLGTPGLSLVVPGQGAGFAAQLEDYAFDIERANAILDEAGYADSDGDGVREMPGDPATPLSLRYSYPSDQSSDGPRIFELLKDMWAQAGVAINLTPMEADALTAVCCPAFDYDVIQWGWGLGSDPSSLLYIATEAEINSGVNESGYSNPEYEALFAEQGVTVDRTKRVELIHKMQEILLRDVPYIIPFYAQSVAVYRTDRFTGWVVEPDGVLNLSNRLSLTAIRPVQ